jgi:predicted DCC family thiol-disulfide oxidoreductase YuxK
MTRYPVVAERRKALWIVVCWLAIVFLFAIQWFIYDAARGDADRFRYYLWWSCYTWGILTPVVVHFAYRNPIKASTWKRALPLHLAASFVLVEGNRVFRQSTATLRIARGLGLPWRLAYGLIAVPRPLRDWIYDVVARHRYQWFGQRAVCMVPTPDVRARFLE